MKAAEALRASPLFKEFTDTGLAIFATIATARSFPKGAVVFAEAMVAESMWIIAEGQVSLVAKTKSGTDVALAEVGPGAFLGELSLLAPGQRLCSASALTPVKAFELRHTDFHKLLASKPQACAKLVMAIAGHLATKLGENRDALKSLVR